MFKILRDPLFHFVLLGMLLFAVYYLINPPDEVVSDNLILITQGDIDRFRQIYKKQWQSDPSPQQLDALIDAQVREEVLYREALAMGLDKDDAIVRRRMAQKVEFLITDVTLPDDVDDEELKAFYDARAADYTRAARLSFRHIYFNPERRGARVVDEAEATLQTLRAISAGLTVAEDLGDSFLLRTQFQRESTEDIARQLGKEFAAKIVTLKPGSWQGPVSSGYGIHLVFVYEREAAAPYPFAQIRERIKNDFLFELRRKRNDEVLEKLKSRYQIIVEGN